MNWRLIPLLALAPLAACGDGAAANSDSVTAKVDLLAPSPAPAGRIADLAHLLTEPQKAELTAKLSALEARTHQQLIVASVTTLGGRNIDDVVEDLGNRMGVHDGVVLIVATQDRQVRLAIGRGAGKLLTPAEGKRIVNQTMYPDLHANRFAVGLLKGADRIIAELSETTA